eukprot:scaffold2212_cov143-Cylindrotheca_fusiformis.AAC.14
MTKSYPYASPPGHLPQEKVAMRRLLSLRRLLVLVVPITLVHLHNTLSLVDTVSFYSHGEESQQKAVGIDNYPPPEEPDYPFEFAGCLLIKDDNIILPEWLAYHYTVMPLRHLIVAVDPLSLTSPDYILDLYRNHTNMTIETWTGNWYWHLDLWSRPELSPPTNPADQLYAHDHRQWAFYDYCLLRLKKLKYTWTQLIDSDEYFTYNTPLQAERNLSAKVWEVMSMEKRDSLLPTTIGKQNETIAHWIHRYGSVFGLTNVRRYKTKGANVRPSRSGLYTDDTFCTASPRLQFFSEYIEPNLTDPFEHFQSKERNISFDQTDFHSLYYTAHDKLMGKAFNGKGSLWSKSLVNAAMMKEGYKARSPHVPYRHCDNHAITNAKVAEGWPFRVHHYTGSMKTFTSRPERTAKMYRERNRMKFFGNYDASATKWFPEFVKLLRQNSSDDGVELAYRLTQKAHDDAYDESMAIKHRVDVLKEEVSPLYEWDKPLTPKEKLRRAWRGV